MEELLTKIGEYVATDVHYLDKQMGYIFVISFEDGRNVMLSLNELSTPEKKRADN